MSRSQAVRLQRDTAFLLNSWALLVTIGSSFHQSQALSRSYSSNWPNSLNYHASMAIGYSPRRPDAVIGTSDTVNYFSLHGPIQQPLMSREATFCQIQDRSSPADQFPWALALSCRKEIPTKRYKIDGEKQYALPQTVVSYRMSTVLPFSTKKMR